MGTSTTTPPQPFSWECGLPTMRAPGLRRARLDQSSEAGALSPRPSDSGLTKRGLEVPPTLLFIGGPGGSHPLEEGWEARLRTLCPSGAVSSSHPPPSQHLGQGPRGPWDMGEQGRR